MPTTIHIKHQVSKQLGLMSQRNMSLDTTPTCMRYRHQQRLGRHPMMPTSNHNHLSWI